MKGSASRGAPRRRGWHSYGRALRFYLDPLAAPYSPLNALSQRRVETYYERTRSDRALAERWGRHYLRGLDLPAGAVLLDYGCGRGRHVALAGQLGLRAVGQDILPHPWWKKLSPSGFQVVSPSSSHLPWQEASFSLVLDVMVIDHLPEDRLAAHAHEVRRVLRPGGYWLLLEANSRGYGARLPRRYYGRLHSLETMQGIAQQAGFRELDHSFEGFYAPIFPRLVNFVRKHCAPWPLDLSDYHSRIARRIPAHRRSLWLLRLQKPATK